MQQKDLLDLALQVRTSTDADSITGAVRNQVRELDPHLPLYNIKTLAAEIDQSLIQERLVTWLTTSFGVLATLLVVIGLYGVLSFSVVRRTREIGIRVALGAQRRDVFLMVIKHGMILVFAGALRRRRSFAGAVAIYEWLVVRHFADERSHFCGGGGGIDCGGAGCVLHPGAARDPRRSVGGSEIRIGPMDE